MMIDFNWYHFSELTVSQLYELLILRSQVFVVEQHCSYLDPDGQDIFAQHLLGIENNFLVSYLRLFPPTTHEACVVFGRVVTLQSSRKKGYGKQLLRELLLYCKQHFTGVDIKCSAQLYLRKFYESFGFKLCGDVYDEDGIPHVTMVCRATDCIKILANQ